MKYSKLVAIIFFSALFTACGNNEIKKKESNKNTEGTQEVKPISFQNKGHELIYKMSQKTGNYQDLLNLKDVVFKYTYRTPDQKEDVSTESYIFNGELSHGDYIKHERTLPELKGKMQQAYNGSDFWITLDGQEVNNNNVIVSATFTRKTNFYWFAMMQKLLDPNINYEYLGQNNMDDKMYDLVKITFKTQNDEASDIYQVYINPETHLIDQFLFTVVSKNVTDPILMRVTYKNVQGILIPTYRKYTKSDWNANVINDVWIEEISEDIQFNQNLKIALFNN